MDNKTYIAGRDARADILLEDSNISRCNMQLVVLSETEVEITDLNSTNGVFVVHGDEQEKVLKAIIPIDTIIIIGKSYRTSPQALLELMKSGRSTFKSTSQTSFSDAP